MFYCPEGAEEFSPGFQPWEPSSSRFALKGREIDSRLILRLTPSILSPFRAIRRGVRFPGLKPWAEFSSPFGAKDLPEHCLT